MWRESRGGDASVRERKRSYRGRWGAMVGEEHSRIKYDVTLCMRGPQ